jgi:threonyl-tRNA synthetase
MHGLIRVRQFTISEGHLILAPEQLEQEFRGCLELARYMLKALGFENDVTYRFSQWDPNNQAKYEGTAEQWNEAQGIMKDILDNIGIEYAIGIDEAAFYGPKLDIQMKNVFGKEDTIITIQIDMLLAKKFGMEYTDSSDKRVTPYIIHRTSLGCYERTLALLLEKYGGAMPMWIAPEQIRIIPIGDEHIAYCKELAAKMEAEDLRVKVDVRNGKVGYKIREAQLQKIPYMLCIGDKEVESQSVAVRDRAAGDLGAMSADEFIAKAVDEVKNLVIR